MASRFAQVRRGRPTNVLLIADLPSSSRFRAAQFAVWATFAGVRFTAALPAVSPEEKIGLVLACLSQAVTGWALTSPLWWGLKGRINPKSAWSWSAVVIAAIVVAFVWNLVDRAVLVTAASILSAPVPWAMFPRGLDLTYPLASLAWSGGALGVLFLQREADLRLALLTQQARTYEAQLHALWARLSPHFLFNSLNTIRSFAAEDPERTREMVTRLASFLRRVLAINPTSPSSFATEIEVAQEYLWIEQARFEPSLQVEVVVPDSANEALVPPLFLQPLVENAVVHGEAGSDGIHRIHIKASCIESRFALEISNTGSVASRSGPKGIGLGLTRERLALMYGDRHSLTMESTPGWVRVCVVIEPIQRSPQRARA